MFRRKNKENQTPTAEIPVLEGRSPNVLRGHEDNPEQPVRILSQYAVRDNETGKNRLQMELVWAQTATEPKRVKVSWLNEVLLTMGERVIKPQLPGVDQQFGRSLVRAEKIR